MSFPSGILKVAAVSALLAVAIPAYGSGVQVPVRHAEKNGVEAVQFSAAQASKRALVIVAYGKDADMIRNVMLAGGTAISRGYPFKGIIFGPQRTDAANVVEFYVDSQLADTLLNPASADEPAMMAEVEREYVDVLKARYP